MTVTTAVVLAAGQGTRLRGHAPTLPKPLVPLGGVPLLLRTLKTARDAGITRAIVVIGYRGGELRAFLEASAKELAPLKVETVDNPLFERANGVSVLAAEPLARGAPFLLMMSDHLLTPALLQGLVARGPVKDGVVLAIDRRVREVFDIDDATKVQTQGERITAIAKSLTTYDAIDCGAFVCTDALFDALRAATRDGDVSLSDGVRRLGEQQRFVAHDIGNAYWQDVDTPEMLAEAERWLATPNQGRT